MPSPGSFPGVVCPNKIQFGRVHGTSPATGSVECDGSYSLPLGSVQALQIGAATFYGIVVKNEVMQTATETLQVSKVSFVDWRDRLHDNHVFGAFNMEDEDGRFYHITPENWAIQRKTFINRELDQQDWNQVQAGMGAQLEVLACTELLSAATLIDFLAILKDFTWTASPIALQVLENARPENVDWNSGIKVVDAVQQLCQKNGLQWTVLGERFLHITLRGTSEDAFINCFLNGGCTICDIGGDSGSVGQELNDRGRKALVVGDFNRYEYTAFACKANWNTKWTAQICYDGWSLTNLLIKEGLTMQDQVKDLPAEWHDPEKINGEDRNDLTIKEYIEQVAWHAYVVDASTIIKEIDPRGELPAEAEDYFPLDRDTLVIGEDPKEFDRKTEPFSEDYNFKFPISDSLLIDSQLRHIAYTSEELLAQGADPPFDELTNMVPQESGTKLDIEATLNPDTCQEEYRVRVMIDKVQTITKEGGNKAKLKDREPDYVFCRLCLNGDLFAWWQGEGGAGIRVREQKRTVSNLYRGFLNNEEQSILRGNFKAAVEAGPGPQPVNPVTAIDIAQRIATQMLFHEAINFSGHVAYSEFAGAVPDGIIETVQSSWDEINGIKETVNFTSGILDVEQEIAFAVINQKLDIKTDEDIKRERILDGLRMHLKKAMTAPGRGATTDGKKHAHEGGHMSHGRKGKLFGKDGAVRVTVPADVYIDHGVIEDGDTVIGSSK